MWGTPNNIRLLAFIQVVVNYSKRLTALQAEMYVRVQYFTWYRMS